MARSFRPLQSQQLPRVTVLINNKSKWSEELRDISTQGWNTKMVDNFDQDLDVMIQCKPKQIVCVVNGADLLFEWKRKQQVRSDSIPITHSVYWGPCPMNAIFVCLFETADFEDSKGVHVLQALVRCGHHQTRFGNTESGSDIQPIARYQHRNALCQRSQ